MLVKTFKYISCTTIKGKINLIKYEIAMKAYTSIARSTKLQLFSTFPDDRRRKKKQNNIGNWQSRVQCFQLAGISHGTLNGRRNILHYCESHSLSKKVNSLLFMNYDGRCLLVRDQTEG